MSDPNHLYSWAKCSHCEVCIEGPTRRYQGQLCADCADIARRSKALQAELSEWQMNDQSKTILRLRTEIKNWRRLHELDGLLDGFEFDVDTAAGKTWLELIDERIAIRAALGLQ